MWIIVTLVCIGIPVSVIAILYGDRIGPDDANWPQGGAI